MRRGRLLAPGKFAPCLLALVLAACGEVEETGEIGFALPTELSEVSGLAVAGPDSIFLHNDEHAIIYEMRVSDGRVLRAFALGDPTIEGDFEGIAANQERVFLVTSDGLIYSALPAEHGQRTSYQVYDSGVGPRCEIEGLSLSPERDGLLLLCKRFRDGTDEALLEIYFWPYGAERSYVEPWLSIPLEQLLEQGEIAEFQPSGIEWDEVGQRALIVSARNRVLLEIDAQGALIDHRKLDEERHPKTEGIALLSDGRMVLADEGSTTRKGKLAVYPLR
jgi:uncharacterized protein YjiK